MILNSFLCILYVSLNMASNLLKCKKCDYVHIFDIIYV